MPLHKVAIVGAGPAGYFAAQALQNLQTEGPQFSIEKQARSGIAEALAPQIQS